jgi:hypothetical protein
MHSTALQPSFLVSPSIYALILTSPKLKGMLLPEGLATSPYEILDYQATLTLEDPKGMKATFHRTQEIRFLQDGVAGVLDHFWGDGVALTSYHNSAGLLKDSFRDQGQRHLVIDLKRSMLRGETLSFNVIREAMAGFTKDDEWVETTVDHPTKRLSRNIIFPKERPCQSATLHSDRGEVPLPIIKLPQGNTLIHFKIDRPLMNTSYTVRWSW